MDESELLLGARRRAGLSQRELARRAGTSQAMVARIERARQSPSAATLRRLIAACGAELEVGIPDAGPGRPPRGTGDGRLMLCEIGGGEYAFPLAAVTEVVPRADARRLPGQPADAGVVVVRDRVLPWVDGAARLGLEAGDPPRRMTLLATRAGIVAVSVTEARGIVGASGDALKPPPPGAGASAVVTALVRVDGRLVVVLDPDVLCDTGRARRDTGAHPA